MKLTINPQELAGQIKKANRVIASKNLIAILDNFLFNVEQETLKMTLTASDNEVFVKMKLGILDADESFSFCVNANKFTQAISAIKSDMLVMEFDGQTTMTCKHKKGRFTIACIGGDDYPQKEMGDEIQSTEIKASVISKSLSDVSYATSNDPLRPQLNGVFFNFLADHFVCVATDTRLLVRGEKVEGNYESLSSFIMPTKAANVLSTFFAGQIDEPITIKNDGQVALFEASDWTIYFRQVQGKFPNYNMVIPKLTDNEAEINKAEFMDSLSRVLLFAPSSNAAVKLHFTMNKIELVSQDIDYNQSSTENVECGYLGKDMTMGFNGQALYEIINNINDDSFIINMTDAAHAAIVQPKDKTVLVLLMPMMI